MNKIVMTICGLSFLPLLAQAQVAGSWLARGGVTQITPQVKSGDLSPPSLPGTTSDVSAATQISGGITYMWRDNIAFDLPLALPFTHKITGAGALAGVGKIGQVDTLPMTLFAQYRFGQVDSQWRPYVGVGPTYAYFLNAKGTDRLTALTGGTSSNPTTLSVQSKLVPTVQVGLSFQTSSPWFVDAMVAQTFLKTTTTLSTGQSLEATLNPLTFSLGVGYRFK